MNKYLASLGALALLAFAPLTSLQAMPIYSDPLRDLQSTGHGINIWSDLLGIYDSRSDRLSITSRIQNAEYWTAPEVFFTSYFDLEAGVDEFGRVTDRGTLRWEGDFGSGRELLATGKLVSLGFADYHVSDDYSVSLSAFLGMRMLLQMDYLDARVQGLGSHVGFYYEQVWLSNFESPFMQDWVCPPGFLNGLRCTEPWSTTGFSGRVVRNVPEPGTIALFGLALLGLVVFRGRRLSVHVCACLTTRPKDLSGR
jgi:hypothetical protein